MAVLATGVIGFLVRQTLSPDGVSYLDLAGALRHGDFQHFVQGYWSPLYPALLAALEPLAGDEPGRQIALAHLLNVVVALLAIAAIWRWARMMRAPWFGRAAFAALIVCSGEPPRVEAVTPDLILLFLATCIGYELVVRRGERWVILGLLFGAAYLTKTGTWPWIVLAMTARTFAAPDRTARLLTLRSHAVTAVIALCWVVPISLQAGHATLGSTGRLNYRWYLESSDARTPDTHRGAHVQYRTQPVADGAPIVWAEFDADRWTYEPWSSPDEWSHGIIDHQATSPTAGWLLAFWVDQLRLAVAVWLRPLLLFVLVPVIWIGRRGRTWRDLIDADRPAAIAMFLGVAGIDEYLAVHAEPRLIAPFALLLALALLDWRVGDRTAYDETPGTLTTDRQLASLLGIAAAVYVTCRRIYFALDDDRRITAGLAALEVTNRTALAPPSSGAGGLAGAVSSVAPAPPAGGDAGAGAAGNGECVLAGRKNRGADSAIEHGNARRSPAEQAARPAATTLSRSR